MSTDHFIKNLTAEMLRSVNNSYSDNYDYYRYGPLQEKKKQFKLKNKLKSILNNKGYFNRMNSYKVANQLVDSSICLTHFQYLYALLEDHQSKNLLIKIIAYHILGHTKVKLPANTPEFWQNQIMIESHQRKDDVIKIDFMHFELPLTDLNFLGVPIKMYYSTLGINIDFIIKQYEFEREDIYIGAETGDVIIDAGGCFGDTALYFAHKAGQTGKVHVFEFIPENIIIFNKNINLNPELGSLINLIDRPLWQESNKDVYYISNGPASKVSFEPLEGFTGKTLTLSIDDYVNINCLDKVDMIKMDIEGAELDALIGAKGTIKNFKPKLAIALYHTTKDFDVIPRFIDNLNLGYKFYLLHATIYGEETMLFANVS